jgi:hypothetical protein
MVVAKNSKAHTTQRCLPILDEAGDPVVRGAGGGADGAARNWSIEVSQSRGFDDFRVVLCDNGRDGTSKKLNGQDSV